MRGLQYLLLFVAVFAVGGCIGGSATPSPSRPGPRLGTTEGCSSSFWARPESFPRWEEYDPDDLVVKLFPDADEYAQMTLLDALHLTPDSDVRLILLRETTAAVLNAASESLEYPYSRYETGVAGRRPIVPTVADLLESGTDRQMAEFAKDLAVANALGCPLESPAASVR